MVNYIHHKSDRFHRLLLLAGRHVVVFVNVLVSLGVDTIGHQRLEYLGHGIRGVAGIIVIRVGGMAVQVQFLVN